MEHQQERPGIRRGPEPASKDDVVLKETMSLESIRETLHEEQGYDAPFATFTWRYWMDAQARAMQCFSRFVRAVEEHHHAHALMIGLEMQEIATSLLLEAYAQSSNLPLEELPAEPLKHAGS